MQPERWQRIEELFHSALKLEESERTTFLEQNCAGDGDLRVRVERLLAHHTEGGSFLESPALEVAARELEVTGDVSEPGNSAADLIGKTVSHYRVLEKLGSGGMGVVYKALDTRLDRLVALKFLPQNVGRDRQALERFQREARAASALDHPNICTVYEIGEEEGWPFIAMQFLEGQSLKQLLGNGAPGIPASGSSPPLPTGQLLDLALQMADALEAAHGRDIIHRDVKPANIFVTQRGQVKLLDFGIAKLGQARPMSPAGASAVREDQSPTELTASAATDWLTRPGAVVGTAAYLSPEQARGEAVDVRSDLFGLGCVLYELATGQRAFPGNTAPVVFKAILAEEPIPPRKLNPAVPAGLETIIQRALEKDRDKRYGSALELSADLARLKRQLDAGKEGSAPSRWLRKPVITAPALLVLVALILVAVWLLRRASQIRWVTESAIPQVSRLIETENYMQAYRLMRLAERYLPRDPTLERLWPEFTAVSTVRTSPAGADVFIKGYSEVKGGWNYLGRSPIRNVRLPLQALRWRMVKPGFTTLEAGTMSPPPFVPNFTLEVPGMVPPGMVPVEAGTIQIGGGPAVALNEFYIDRYEVTNREFKRFVAAGGYRNPRFWKYPFVKDGRTLSWAEAMRLFIDRTGRPGPATWELGDYPGGEDDFPVGGVSWYEAAAYATFAGKTLPTVYHWFKAAGAAQSSVFSSILSFSNFDGRGPARVGSYLGLGPYGTYDMAGNVKEWCWNQLGNNRYILGGAWNDPPYTYGDPDARPPFDRSSSNGFRCIKEARGSLISETLTRPVDTLVRDFNKERPVPDAIFRVFKRLYDYDPAPLDSKIEYSDASPKYWIKQRVSYNAAYGKERVIAHLFLPKNAVPPYQAIVYFPHGGAATPGSSEDADMFMLDGVIRSGRALLYPVYKGMYERYVEPSGVNAMKEMLIEDAKDLRRSVDYLETRPDVDHHRLAYYGISWGSELAPIMLAVEPRLKAAVLWAGGFDPKLYSPEVEAINFAPHVTVPVLMLTGRYDLMDPLETSQNPMFRLLGTPAADKRHVVYDSGHVPPREPSVKETLDWLDRYLGAVD
jgi:eukaryotic-like serine/threonine-protein kinase